MKQTKLDKWFSIYIRLRDSDENGMCRCITCGQYHFWRDMDCGHFIKRQHQGVRFNEKNAHAQCRGCNWLKQGDDAEYERQIIKRYGRNTLHLLRASIRVNCKRSPVEVDLLTKEFEQKARQLAKEKGLKI